MKSEIYTLGKVTEYETEDIIFSHINYSVVREDVTYSGDIFLATRKMAYVMIISEGQNNTVSTSYRKYGETALSIIEEFRFSVFKY